MHLTASIIATITVHMGDVNGVAFSGDKLATGSGDKKVRLFSMDTWKERAISPLQGHTYYVNCVAFSPFGAQLASCSTDGKCILWDPRSGTKIAILEHPSKNGLRVCTFSPNGATLATAGDDETIALWDTSMRTITRSLVGHEAWVTTCDFTPDSTYLISGSTGGELRLWDARYGHGKCLVLVKVAHDLGVTSSQFSSRHGVQGSTVEGSVAGKFLLATCGQDNDVKLWNVRTGLLGVSITARTVLRGHESSVMCVCFSHSARLLASGSGDKTVILWDMVSPCQLLRIAHHERYVTCCAFSDDDSALATGSGGPGAVVALWRLNEATPDAVAAAEEIAVRAAPPGERTSALASSLDKRLRDWTTDDVCDWLDAEGFGEHCSSFRSHKIDGDVLAGLTDEAMRTELGIAALGDRMRLLQALQRTVARLRHERSSSGTLSYPDELLCPVTREIMQEPVMAADGYTYERRAIGAWMEAGKMTSPMTNEPLADANLAPNRSLRLLIQHYLENHST